MEEFDQQANLEEEQDDLSEILGDDEYKEFLKQVSEDKDSINLFDSWEDEGDYYDSTEDDFSFGELDLMYDDGSGDAKKSDLINLFLPKLKSKTVNYEGVSNKLKEYLSNLPEELRDRVVVTSGMDGTHTKGSKHYRGNALDLRYDKELHDYIAKTAQGFGLRTMNPNHGTAPHTHLEVMQYGGYDYGYNAYNRDPYQSKPNYKSAQYEIDPAYLTNKFNTDMNTTLSSNPYPSGSYTKSSDPNYYSSSGGDPVSSGISAGISAVGNIMDGLDSMNKYRKMLSQKTFELADSGINAAIQVLGEKQQNQEIRRLQKMRADESQTYTNYTPQIKNIPVYI